MEDREMTLREEIALRFATAMLQGMMGNHSIKGPHIKDQRPVVLKEAAVWADAFIAVMSKDIDGQ